MIRPATIAALLLLPYAASAATRYDAGISFGQQSYQSRIDDPRSLPGVEVVMQRGRAGVEVAADFTDLSEEGTMIAIHPNVRVEQPLGGRWFAAASAGPTYVYASGGSVTWNMAAELRYAWDRTSVFARVRHYDYGLARFREGEAGPNGPAVYAGVRWRIR